MGQEKIQKVIITREQIRKVYDRGSEAVETLVSSLVDYRQHIPPFKNKDKKKNTGTKKKRTGI